MRRGSKHTIATCLKLSEKAKKRPNNFAHINAWRKRNPSYQNGELNPFWKGGLSKSNINRICKRVLTSANVDMFVCRDCGKVSSIRHNIHHKDGDRTNNIPSNLEVLCSVCHNSGWALARHTRTRDTKGRFICRNLGVTKG